MLRRFLVGRACLHRLPTRAGPPMDEWMKRAPRPGITSFTGFHPSFHGAPWTPAEFYKMRHMRYIIAQCELPRYSKRGLNGSVPETATKSRKSFMKRDYFSCARTTRRAFAHSLHPSTMLSLSLSLLHRFSSPLARILSLSRTHTRFFFFWVLFCLESWRTAFFSAPLLCSSEIYSREDTSPERISHVPLESESTRLHPRSLHPAVLFLSFFWGWFFVACKIPCFFFPLFLFEMVM